MPPPATLGSTRQLMPSASRVAAGRSRSVCHLTQQILGGVEPGGGGQPPRGLGAARVLDVGDGHDLDAGAGRPARQVAVERDVAQTDDGAAYHRGYESPCWRVTTSRASSRMASPARAWSSRMTSGGLMRMVGA